jgi:predicted nucleotidyltransferase
VRSVPRAEVEQALAKWAKRTAAEDVRLQRVGYFGSYARGDYTPASDLDVLVIVSSSQFPRHRRALEFDLREVPVGCEVFVYTTEELAPHRSAGDWLPTILP